MTKQLMYTLNYLLLLPLLFSCGGPTASQTITSDTESTEQVSADPVLDVVEAPVMEKDVMETTAEASQEHIAEEKMPEPEILDTAPPAKPQTIPTPPKKPVSDGTTTEAPVVAQTPPPVATNVKVEAPTTTETPLAAPAATPAAPKVPDHEAWNTLLQQYVNSAGKVNYAAFKKQEAQLDEYLAELASNTPTPDWTRREGMAYWINAYNAATIKLILKNWPVKSIMDLHGGKPWDLKWINLGGKTYSLNNIEHDILRPRYKDPGIHFAVNCAANSCPPIPNQAFTPSNLTGLMSARAKSFIRNPAYNTIGEKVSVSKIFDWYGEDFGELRDYLNEYAKTPIPDGTKIEFREYDWALNKQ